MEEKNGTVVIPWAVFIETNQSNAFWNTRSPTSPCSERIAFRRDLVVLDCQPPSKRRMKVSPTSAILLPWRNTVERLASSSKVTAVFADRQFWLLEMALFICCSILRMREKKVVCLVCGQYRAPKGRIRGGVDGSATVPIVAGVPLITAAVVVFRREIIIEVTVAHVVSIVGRLLPCPSRDGSEGETVEVGLFVCHVAIVGPNGSVFRSGGPVLQVSHCPRIRLHTHEPMRSVPQW